MKNVLLLLFSLILIEACSSKSEPKQQANDTTFTVVAYSFDWNKNDNRLSTARRVVYDTLMPSPADKSRNIVRRDTLYLIPFISKKDTVESVAWIILPKELLLMDFNKSFLPFPKE